MKRPTATVVLVIGLSVSASASSAQPTLYGADVQRTNHNYGTFGVFAHTYVDSAIVGPGIEFDNVVEPEIVDVGLTTITYRQAVGSAVFGPTELDEIILTFASAPIIDGALLLPGHGVGGLDQAAITFGPNFVSLLLAGVAWETSDVAVVQLALVREPPPVWMLVPAAVLVVRIRIPGFSVTRDSRTDS